MNPSIQNSGNLLNESAPLVSVIVPAYNHEAYIAECVRSILEQDYPHIDLIIINDGSTDSTDQKVCALAEEYFSRFRYISKKNEGLIKTLNLGLRLAHGEYLCELASDDILLRGSIRKRIEYLVSRPAVDVVFADAFILNEQGRTTERLMVNRKSFRSSEHTVQDLIEGRAKIFFPSGMFRKSFLERLGGFDEDFRDYEDVAMKFQLAIHANIDYLDEPVLYYRRHGSNTSSTNKFSLRKEKVLALEKLLSSYQGDERLIKSSLGKEYLKLVKISLTHPATRDATKRTLAKAFKIRPFNVKLWYYFARYLIRI